MGIFGVCLAGCSGTSSVPIGDDGGAARVAAADGGATTLPTGTCSFDASGAIAGSRTGVAFAKMNGSGNLIVTCGDLPDGADEELELDIGNGDYEGPGTYSLDEASSSGSITYTLDAPHRFEPKGASSGCTATITVAPQTDFAPRGSTIAGTFTCHALVARDGGRLDLSSGAFSAPVR
jgi:hypothetical protein